MAIKKATTADDIKVDNDAPAPPTHEERVQQVVDLTDPDMVAEVKAPGYTKLTSPTGAVTTVPDSIVDSLVQSGYSKSE